MKYTPMEPAAVWRQLIPARYWLFPKDMANDELVFTYRDKIYFVNFDGSVLSIPRPPHLELFDLAMLYDRLATSEEIIDFDDEGIFDYGTILRRMGYVVPTSNRHEKHTYRVEIINTLAPESFVSTYELKKVCYQYALYYGLMKCYELNAKSDWEFEHEVRQIVRVDPVTKKEPSSRTL